MDNEIKQDAKDREAAAKAAEKATRDTKFFDLEDKKLDEEAQLEDLEEELNKQKKARNQAVLNDDNTEFDEKQARVEETQKLID